MADEWPSRPSAISHKPSAFSPDDYPLPAECVVQSDERGDRRGEAGARQRDADIGGKDPGLREVPLYAWHSGQEVETRGIGQQPERGDAAQLWMWRADRHDV